MPRNWLTSAGERCSRAAIVAKFLTTVNAPLVPCFLAELSTGGIFHLYAASTTGTRPWIGMLDIVAVVVAIGALHGVKVLLFSCLLLLV